MRAARGGGAPFDKFKARLVAKGSMQRLGFDFFSTFSPMATLTTVRTVFAIAVRLGLPIYHADIPQAFVTTANRHRENDAFGGRRSSRVDQNQRKSEVRVFVVVVVCGSSPGC